MRKFLFLKFIFGITRENLQEKAKKSTWDFEDMNEHKI